MFIFQQFVLIQYRKDLKKLSSGLFRTMHVQNKKERIGKFY